MAKAAAPRHTASIHEPDCPLHEHAVEAQFQECVRASRALSAGVLEFLKSRSDAAQAKWAQNSVEAGRVLFQPWSMEIVFVLAILREARFGQLQDALGGISSRTLSDKLQTLRAEGLVERKLYDEQPVRIEYQLTKEGVRTAALATPLFAHLNHRARQLAAP